MTDRLRFVGFKLDRLPSGECRARVTLAWPDGPRFEGEARGARREGPAARGPRARWAGATATPKR